jgi:O-antigen/teichoic acid export membrane protein
MNLFKKYLFFSSAGTIFEATLLFVRNIIVIKSLTIEDYGTSVIVTNFFALLSLIFYFRIGDIILKYHDDENKLGGARSLSTLYFYSTIIPLLSSLIISIPIVLYSNIITDLLYSNTDIAKLVLIFIPSFILSSLNSVTTTSLRILGRYVLIAFVQTLGAMISLLVIIVHVFVLKKFTLKILVIIISCTNIIVSITFLIYAIIILNKKYDILNYYPSFKNFNGKHKELKNTFLNVNITGWLKSGGDIGGLFLLGVLTDNASVGLYGFAKQFIKPITLIQTSIYNVLMPKMINLMSSDNFEKVLIFVKNYTLKTFTLMILACLLLYPFLDNFIIFASKNNYTDAKSIILILMLACTLTISFLPFYPIALKLNLVGRRNIIVSFRFIYLLSIVLTNFSAISFACSNLAGVITTRIFFDTYAYKKIKNVIKKKV